MNAEFTRCCDFLAEMIEKYGPTVIQDYYANNADKVSLCSIKNNFHRMWRRCAQCFNCDRIKAECEAIPKAVSIRKENEKKKFLMEKSAGIVRRAKTLFLLYEDFPIHIPKWYTNEI